MHAVTDDDFVRDRERILFAIDALNKELKENEIALRFFHRFRANATEGTPNTPKARKNVGYAEETPNPDPTGNQKTKPIIMSEVSCRVIFAQTDEFTTIRIGAHLQKHFPDIAARLPPSYITTLLWRLANRGKVAVVRKAHGKPNVYVVISKK